MQYLLNTSITSFIFILGETPWWDIRGHVQDLLFVQMSKMLGSVINIVYYITAFAINILQSASTSRLMTDNITEGWQQSLFYVNVIAVFILIAIALANALRLNIETYEIKKTLPGLIAGFILANFSLLICRAVLDLSDVITFQLTQSAGGGGNLANRIMELITMVSFEPGEPLSLGDGTISSVLDHFATFASIDLGAGTIAYLAFLIMAFIWFAIPAVIIFILAMIMMVRYVILMVLVIVSPIAIILFFFPASKSIGTKWIDEFIKWAFLPPIVFFILRLATFFGVGSNAISYNYNPIPIPNKTEIVQYKQHTHYSLSLIETAFAAPDEEVSDTIIDPAANMWEMVLGYIAGIGILIAAIFVPFQLGGLGGQLMNWAGKIGKGAALGVGKAGVSALDDRLQIGEKARRTWAKTPFGKWKQQAEVNKRAIKEDTEGINKKTQQEHLTNRKNQMLARGQQNSGEYSAVMKQYRALTKEIYTPAAEHQSLDTHAKNVADFNTKHPGALDSIINNKPFPPGMNISPEEEGKVRAALWGIGNYTKDWDTDKRKRAEALEEQYMPNSNRDHFGPLAPHKDPQDQAVFRAIDNNITDPTIKNIATQEYARTGTIRPNINGQTIDMAKITDDANKFAGSKSGSEFSLNNAWKNNFNANVLQKSNNIISSHPKARFNNAALQQIKTYIDNGEFDAAHKFAKSHNLGGIAPGLEKMKINSIEQATLSVSLEEIMNANKAIFSDTAPIDLGAQKIDINNKIITAAKQENGQKMVIELNNQKNIVNKFESQVKNIRSSHTKESKSISKYAPQGQTNLSNYATSPNFDNAIGDLKNKDKYTQAFIEDFLPEINTNKRENIKDEINKLGEDYKKVVAKRLIEIGKENTPPPTPPPPQDNDFTFEGSN